MNYDVLIILGGGRNKDGSLTEMSKQRLDKGCELFNNGVAKKIFALGGHRCAYTTNAIRFNMCGAEQKKAYMLTKGVKEDAIIVVDVECRDTIGEAFASRSAAVKHGFKDILVVTSDKHLNRSLYIFKRIFGDGFKIYGFGVSCGDLLNEDDEKEQLELVQNLFKSFPIDIPTPISWDQWYKENSEFYGMQTEIHKKYRAMGEKTSQAYLGVSDTNLF